MKKFALTVFIIMLMILPGMTFIPIGEKDSQPEMDIYLVSNAIHVGIILPLANEVMDWKPFLVNNFFPKIPEGAQWIEFGWGDRRFYFEMPTWEQFTLGLAADALFWPDPAVMHVEVLGRQPTPSSYVRRVRISFSTYQKMVAATKSWFVLKNNHPILIADKGYGEYDNFFEARGSYSLIRTCNVWTSEIFAESGLLHPLWAPTKHGLEMLWDE